MSNIYEVLGGESHSKPPRAEEGPGKPDKSDQRRSAPRGGPADGASASASSAASSASNHAPHERHRVDAKDRHPKGDAATGRGGFHAHGHHHTSQYRGDQSDGVHRAFDRKGGEHHKHAPGTQRKEGAVGEIDNKHFQGSTAEFAQQDAANVAEANADIVGEQVLAVTPINPDPDEGKLTLEQYLAKQNVPKEDLERKTRAVTNDGFKGGKTLSKHEEVLFEDVQKRGGEKKDNSEGGKKSKKTKISLDEFVSALPAGSSGSAASSSASAPSPSNAAASTSNGVGRGGGGYRGAGRGGAPGGRGGGKPQANVNIADQSAFPALGGKAN